MDKFKETFKNGYTLAEVLIVLGIIGIVAAFMIPSVMTGVPSRYESLQKKTAYMLESTISDIVNNEVYYERMDHIYKDENDHNVVTYTHGLANTYPVNIDGHVYGSYDNKIAAQQKFCQIFASKFQLKEGTSVNCSSIANFVVSRDGNNPILDKTDKELHKKIVAETNTPTFTSAEGIQWILPVGLFTKNTVIMYKTSADYKSGPNCAYVSKKYFDNYVKPALPGGIDTNYIKTKKEECDRPDIFVYVLTPGGKLIKEEATSDEVAERNSYKRPSDNQNVKEKPSTPKPLDPITPKPVNPTPLIPKS